MQAKLFLKHKFKKEIKFPILPCLWKNSNKNTGRTRYTEINREIKNERSDLTKDQI